MSEDSDRWIIDQLVGFASSWTGFSNEAILPDAIRRALRLMLAESGSSDDLIRQASAGDAQVRHVLEQAVSVGETYFFRHPEHFQFITNQVLPRRYQSGAVEIRAWSAGCATGEETYSIASTLLANPPRDRPIFVEVLGTDLLERNVAAARQGIYKQWSIRPSGPILYPTFHHLGDGRVEVNPEVRQHTTFQARNLLVIPPVEKGLFDIIFCRNVLVYFSPEAMQKVYENLSAALAPEGVLMLGTMDVQGTIPGLIRIGPPEMQMYARPGSWFAPAKEAHPTKPRRRLTTKHPIAHAHPTPPPLRRAVTVPPRKPSRAPASRPRRDILIEPDRPLEEPVAVHLRALAAIERGDRRSAEQVLTDLCRKAPEYLPGLLERALLHIRNGERTAATTLMRQVFRRAATLEAEQTVAGPEPLPAGFYKTSAEAFLRRQGVA